MADYGIADIEVVKPKAMVDFKAKELIAIQ